MINNLRHLKLFFCFVLFCHSGHSGLVQLHTSSQVGEAEDSIPRQRSASGKRAFLVDTPELFLHLVSMQSSSSESCGLSWGMENFEQLVTACEEMEEAGTGKSIYARTKMCITGLN